MAKASYSRYYESMYTSEFASINANNIVTTGVATYAWAGAFDAAGRPVLGAFKSQAAARFNSIDPNLKDPKDDEIMFAFQRELMNNVSFNIDWIQRWFNDNTIDQNCYGLPCNTTASTAYVQNKLVTDFGPDNLTGTADDKSINFWQVAPAYLGKDTMFHTNCGNNTSISCTQRYKAIEMSLSKRMSNRWQMQGSYVWSRLDGDLVLDYTNPNNALPFVGSGRGTADQPHAFKVLGSYQAPYGITVGANFQALSGLPLDRVLSVPLSQGTANVRVDPRGAFQQDFLKLLSLRADKSFRLGGGHRASFVAELHNLLNSSAGQNSYGTVTRGFANQAAFDAGAPGDVVLRPRAGDRRSARAEDRIQAGLLEAFSSLGLAVDCSCSRLLAPVGPASGDRSRPFFLYTRRRVITRLPRCSSFSTLPPAPRRSSTK